MAAAYTSRGARCEEAIEIMRHLGMEVTQRKTGHWTGKHATLVDSVFFPFGVVTVNCHAFGKQGVAHPAAIKDIVRAARIIHGEEENE